MGMTSGFRVSEFYLGSAGCRTASFGTQRIALCRYLVTRNETNRRVEMPARSGSPDLRARTNMTSSCWLWVAGKPPSLFICRVAQPSEPVGCSLGIENWL